MKHFLVIAALVFAGCGKKSGGDGPSCADAVAKAVGAMPGGAGGGDEVKTKLTGIMTTRCTDDKWSADVRKCYANDVKDMASMKTCRSKLPQDQQDKLMTDIRSVMMGAMGAGGGPMHGAGGPPMPPDGTGMQPPPAGSAAPPPAGSAAP